MSSIRGCDKSMRRTKIEVKEALQDPLPSSPFQLRILLTNKLAPFNSQNFLWGKNRYRRLRPPKFAGLATPSLLPLDGAQCFYRVECQENSQQKRPKRQGPSNLLHSPPSFFTLKAPPSALLPLDSRGSPEEKKGVVRSSSVGHTWARGRGEGDSSCWRARPSLCSCLPRAPTQVRSWPSLETGSCS